MNGKLPKKETIVNVLKMSFVIGCSILLILLITSAILNSVDGRHSPDSLHIEDLNVRTKTNDVTTIKVFLSLSDYVVDVSCDIDKIEKSGSFDFWLSYGNNKYQKVLCTFKEDDDILNEIKTKVYAHGYEDDIEYYIVWDEDRYYNTYICIGRNVWLCTDIAEKRKNSIPALFEQIQEMRFEIRSVED